MAYFLGPPCTFIQHHIQLIRRKTDRGQAGMEVRYFTKKIMYTVLQKCSVLDAVHKIHPFIVYSVVSDEQNTRPNVAGECIHVKKLEYPNNTMCSRLVYLFRFRLIDPTLTCSADHQNVFKTPKTNVRTSAWFCQ